MSSTIRMYVFYKVLYTWLKYESKFKGRALTIFLLKNKLIKQLSEFLYSLLPLCLRKMGPKRLKLIIICKDLPNLIDYKHAFHMCKGKRFHHVILIILIWYLENVMHLYVMSEW